MFCNAEPFLCLSPKISNLHWYLKLCDAVWTFFCCKLLEIRVLGLLEVHLLFLKQAAAFECYILLFARSRAYSAVLKASCRTWVLFSNIWSSKRIISCCSWSNLQSLRQYSKSWSVSSTFRSFLKDLQSFKPQDVDIPALFQSFVLNWTVIFCYRECRRSVLRLFIGNTNFCSKVDAALLPVV